MTLTNDDNYSLPYVVTLLLNAGRDEMCLIVFRSRHAVKNTAGTECSVPARPQFAAAWSAADTIHPAHRDASTSTSASSPSPACANTRHLPAYTGSTATSRTHWSFPATNVRGTVNTSIVSHWYVEHWQWSHAVFAYMYVMHRGP